MANLTQLEVTNFYCSATDFADPEYHYDRLWRSNLYMFKMKVFKVMFHYARVQSNQAVQHFPENWSEFGSTLPINHVLNQDTFKMIMVERYKGDVKELQKAGYSQLTVHQVELFDQCSAAEYLKSSFTLNEFVMAACRVQVE
jgi:hypothetical protein